MRRFAGKPGSGWQGRALGCALLLPAVAMAAEILGLHLEALRQDLRGRNGQWILDLDISNYFGTIDHRSLRTALDQRVKDGLVRKLIDKWLKAGVLEEGIRTVPAEGTPQGGVLSPLPANVFLHYVLDTWFHRDVVPRLRGRRRMVRFADEAVCVFEHRVDAE